MVGRDLLLQAAEVPLDLEVDEIVARRRPGDTLVAIRAVLRPAPLRLAPQGIQQPAAEVLSELGGCYMICKNTIVDLRKDISTDSD